MEVASLLQKEFQTIQKSQPLSQLVSRLGDRKVVLIFDGEQFAGVVEGKFLLKSTLNTSETKIADYVRKIPTITPQTDLRETARLMVESHTRLLPVAEGGVIIGVVRVLDLLHTLSNQPEAGHLPVTSCKLVKASVQPSDSVSVALSTMFKNHVDRLPVLSDGKVVGIITEKDILRKWQLSSQKGEFSLPRRAQTRAFKTNIPSLKELPLSSFDTHVDIRTVRSTETLGRAIEQMYQHNINNILVEQNGSFVGLLAPLVILQKLLELSQEQTSAVTLMGVHETHLQPQQIAYVQQVATQEAAKLQRELQNPVTVKLHIKEYFHAEGKKRHKYAVTLQVNYPGRTITGSQDDWDIETAVRKTFANALNEVTKKLRKAKRA